MTAHPRSKRGAIVIGGLVAAALVVVSVQRWRGAGGSAVIEATAPDFLTSPASRPTAPLPVRADPTREPDTVVEVSAALPESRERHSPLVDDLIAALEATETRYPDAFHEPAAKALVDFATRAARDIPSDAERQSVLLPDLMQALDRRLMSPRVRGALLAAVGGLGAIDPLVDLIPASGEERRSAIVGLAWDPFHGPASPAVVLSPSDFLFGRKKLLRELELDVLPLPMSRLPSLRVREWLATAALRPEMDEGESLSAELAELAFGTAIDADAFVLTFVTDRLRDSNALLLYLQEAALFILTRAHSDAAKTALHEFLGRARHNAWDDLLHYSAMNWLAAKPIDSAMIHLMALPLLDPGVSDDVMDAVPKIMAAASLFQRATSPNASPEEIADIEDVLVTSTLRAHDKWVHLPAVDALRSMPGGESRLFALENVLQMDPDASCRRVAAIGLRDTKGPLADQAHLMLQRALAGETDPRVRDAMTSQPTSGH
ncbi:MAG: hypothetical protein HYR85_05220 [Planctomycetes bacterium]|nr:hypothetical protein [Planctomycetota bacterium]MBI3846168.1 hypothetical protein [Planctomycetota bacterium]